jgi:histidyl-tRNA synthetase
MSEKKLAKLFYVANVFSFEETGKETREKWQCGAELIGADSTTADAELVLLALEVLKKLGLKRVELRVSHAGLIRALLGKLGLSPGEQTKVFDQILDGDTGLLIRLKPERPELGRLLATMLDLKGKSSGFLKNMKALFSRDLPELEPALDNFIGVTTLLEVLGVNYQIDITSGRGFEYYTGVMFQLHANGEQVGGGGRYDALIPLMGGPNVPASGFALYLDRLMNFKKPGAPAGGSVGGVLIKAGEGAVREAFDLVGFLHDAGYQAEVYLGNKEPADIKWTLNVRAKAPRFVLTDQVSQQRFEAKTKNEVLTLLKT